ncbi:MAG TPA: DUF2804 domain-containing protein [Clostridiaceae bacterium]
MLNKSLYKEREIFQALDLCDSAGKLRDESIGWSRNPVFNCNLSGHFLRKKKWNYWCITNEDCLFSVTISNLDYVGMTFVYFLDLKTHKFIEKTFMTPLGNHCSMPNNVHESVSFKNSGMELGFVEEDNATHIVAKCSNFMGNLMKADLKVNYPKGHETLNVVIPWSTDSFQFTSKQQCLPTRGILTIGESLYIFEPDTAFATLDFGRGIWPYKVMWNWATASVIQKGKSIGFNLGAKWTDGTGLTENCIIIDGKILKLSEDIIYEYDPKDIMKPWILKTALTTKIDLIFTPFYERIAKSNLLIIKSEVHQMIGYFSGVIKTDAGEVIPIKSMLGTAEDHFAKW